MRSKVTKGSSKHAEVSCPACGTGKIRFVPQLLATGVGFSCSGCGAKLALGEDARRIYASSLDQLEKLASAG